jgi:hypothetical protein
MAITSKEINLTQLGEELGNKGLIVNFTDPKKKIILPADGVDLTEDELKDAIAKHVAIDEVAARAQAKAAAESKLSALGLTTDDLRALGL